MDGVCAGSGATFAVAGADCTGGSEPAVAPAHTGGSASDLARDKVTLSGGAAPMPNYEAQVAAARSLVTQDPKRAAQIVKEWVSTDGR